MNNALKALETLITRYNAVSIRMGSGRAPSRETFNRNVSEYICETGWSTLADYAMLAERMVEGLEADAGRDEAMFAEARAEVAQLKADGKCTRCGGAGHLHQYDAVNGGVCFECDGSGVTAELI